MAGDSTLRNRISTDLSAAIKARDEQRRTVLRSLTAAITNAEIAGGPLDETGLTKLLAKQLKQREESVAAYESRPDLAAQEQAEADIIADYLPTMLTAEELEPMVAEAITEAGASSIADMGKVMGVLNGRTAGRADNAVLAGLVKAKLGD